MKNLLTSSLILISLTTQSFAEVNQVIMIDEGSQRICQVTSEENMHNLSIEACSQNEESEIRALDQLPKNPQFAVIGQVISGLISYYMICSTVQFSPDLLKKGDELLNQRTVGEKLKDAIQPSSNRQTFNSIVDSAQTISEAVTGTLCLPVGAANKQLLYIYNK